jgi:hypothetical protein
MFKRLSWKLLVSITVLVWLGSTLTTGSLTGGSFLVLEIIVGLMAIIEIFRVGFSEKESYFKAAGKFFIAAIIIDVIGGVIVLSIPESQEGAGMIGLITGAFLIVVLADLTRGFTSKKPNKLS